MLLFQKKTLLVANGLVKKNLIAVDVQEHAGINVLLLHIPF